MSLFDQTEFTIDQLADPGLSAGRRRTIRARVAIAEGRHPANGLPIDLEHRCGDCDNLHRGGRSDRVWLKCPFHRLGPFLQRSVGHARQLARLPPLQARHMSAQGHIVAQPGDKKALCGIKDPLPRTWANAVQSHIDGHNPQWCHDCLRIWKETQ